MKKKPLWVGGLSLLLGVWFLLLPRTNTDPVPKPTPTPTEVIDAVRPVKTPVLAPTPGHARKPDTRAVRSTVRAFLKEYLPYSYGNGKPEFKSASSGFRADLLAQPPIVPARIRKLKAHITLVQVDYIDGRRAQAGAMVKDSEGAQYPIRVALGLQGERWYVMAIGG